MQKDTYRLNFEAEDVHWWFLARRRILEVVLRRFLPGGQESQPAHILDYGCGTGGNHSLLTSFGHVLGVDMSDDALEFCRQRGIQDALKIETAEGTPPGPFDLIACLDVLEHVPDDTGLMSLLRARLKPEGRLIVTVPAYQWLWSGEDVVSRHLRRYTRTGLVQCAMNAGFEIEYSSYFSTLLLPIIAGVVLCNRWFRPERMQESDVRPCASWLNTILRRIFESESLWLRYSAFPFGASLLMICRPLGRQ